MPVYLNSNSSNHHCVPFTQLLSERTATQCFDRSKTELSIGLINNMSDSALGATERQFVSLLNAASHGFSVHLSLYTLPEIPRGASAACHIRNCYSNLETLLDTQIDGLIVTGREPLAKQLTEEVYWRSFTKVVDWAHENTLSTVWSCLAAHGAVLHLDGIGRVRSNIKHCGVFHCERLSNHPLIAGTPARFELPHSRWNGIQEDRLTACGYRVLTRTAHGDVDTFIKRDASMFVFFQGHPEYESNTLMLEYRRDIVRYLRGEASSYPAMPRSYFDSETAIALAALQEQASFGLGEKTLADVSAILKNLMMENTWQATSASIYRNWLEYIYTQKQLRAVDLPPRGSSSSTRPVPDLDNVSAMQVFPALNAN